MAIYRRFDTSAFSVADQARMGTAYELLLSRLNLTDRNDPLTELLATRVIEAFQNGRHSTPDICHYVLLRIGVPDGLEQKVDEKR